MAQGRRKRSRGFIEERPNGTLRVIVYAGIDPLTKKPRYLKKNVGTNWKEAEKELTKLLNQVDERRHPRTNITVREVISRWMEVARHEDSTRERYEQLIRLYIDPTFGDTPAAKLDAELLERFYARLGVCRDLCNGRRKAGHACVPLAANTIRKIHFILRASFERAVKWKYLGTNEAALAEPPHSSAANPIRPPRRRRQRC